jgi:lipopolysaccharide export system protein LptC
MVADMQDGSEGRGGAPGGKPPPSGPPRYSLANSYSLFVGFMKLALPAIGIGLLLLIVVWPQLQREGRVAIESLEVTEQDLTDRKMLNPRYESYDSDDRPFTITAELAEQDATVTELINLKTPAARVQMDGGQWVRVTSPNGTYNENNEIIELEGGVDLLHDDGITVQTERATVNVKEGVAESDTATNGASGKGTLEGEGFRILEEGRVIILKGKSKVVLYEQPKEDGSDPTAASPEKDGAGSASPPEETNTQ